MKRAIALVVFLLCTGCTTLSSEEVTVGCQMADAGTTLFTLAKGTVHEANPFVAGAMHVFGPLGLFLVKGVTVAILLAEREKHPNAVAAANVGTCAVAAHNLFVAR